jgi:hypothetical protein
MRALRGLAAVLAFVAVLSPRTAGADDVPGGRPWLLDRPHTVASLEGGIIVLPDAPISQSNRGGYTFLPGPLRTVGQGDATIEIGAHVLYRPHRDWAIGAGAIFAPNPTTDPNVGSSSTLRRSHSRSYLFLGGEGRFVPLHVGSLEGWVGLTAGAVIVADRFTNESIPSQPSLLGRNEVTVDSEGFAVGLQVGADYRLADQVTAGLAIRADQWFLPAEKPFSQISSCDPIGDCPTLTGRVTAFEFGLTISYHIPL